jgi:hypothetical protein
MKASLLDKRLERNQRKWSWKGAKTNNMKRMKSWSKNKTTKTNNSW